ncbi:MAG: DUF192 domain-containing protein [Thermincola sp.]|jgi:uncharacterized membrane protein (UPF0127 family)|nr:DUF192 domain-containing protein [Thermincola sp.]MDT3703394.1 DUF192 domain-containing protein [Thermincola sp.]
MKLVNETRGAILAEDLEIADTWRGRLKGLLGRKNLHNKQGLILTPCKSVHTCFMKFNIDVLFFDKGGRIVYVIENMPPFRFSPLVGQAKYALELPAGTLDMTGTSPGDRVAIIEGCPF